MADPSRAVREGMHTVVGYAKSGEIGIAKNIRTVGYGRTPKMGEFLLVDFSIYAHDGTVLFRGKNKEICLGQCEVWGSGVDLRLVSMRVGERALITCGHEFAGHDNGHPQTTVDLQLIKITGEYTTESSGPESSGTAQTQATPRSLLLCDMIDTSPADAATAVSTVRSPPGGITPASTWLNQITVGGSSKEGGSDISKKLDGSGDAAVGLAAMSSPGKECSSGVASPSASFSHHHRHASDGGSSSARSATTDGKTAQGETADGGRGEELRPTASQRAQYIAQLQAIEAAAEAAARAKQAVMYAERAREGQALEDRLNQVNVGGSSEEGGSKRAPLEGAQGRKKDLLGKWFEDLAKKLNVIERGRLNCCRRPDRRRLGNPYGAYPSSHPSRGVLKSLSVP